MSVLPMVHELCTSEFAWHICSWVFCLTWSHRPWSRGRAPNLCHRRIQEAGVLSVIERSGGLFGQVLKMETFCLKMEETPKWHKMTIVSPKKIGTLITNLHYLCWDFPFLIFLGMTAAAVRSSLWPGYSAGPFWGIWDGKSHGKTEEFSSSKIWGGTQNGGRSDTKAFGAGIPAGFWRKGRSMPEGFITFTWLDRDALLM